MKISSVLLFIMLQKVHSHIRFYRILRIVAGINLGDMELVVMVTAA